MTYVTHPYLLTHLAMTRDPRPTDPLSALCPQTLKISYESLKGQDICKLRTKLPFIAARTPNEPAIKMKFAVEEPIPIRE